MHPVLSMRHVPALLLLLLSTTTAAQDVELEKVFEVDLGQPVGQMRAVPVDLGAGAPQAVLLVHGVDAEVDPWAEMFFFPRGTLRLTLVTTSGEVLWTRDLGRGVVPGVWFCPVFPFDLDGDGIDEIWYVDNTDPDHPLTVRSRSFVRLDARTGHPTGAWQWPPVPSQSPSHQYRYFILGGHVHGEPVLVTAQGTYGPMALQAWNADMTRRWSISVAEDTPGARGSHMTPVVDLDHDDVDEILWGERVLDLDTGRQQHCGACDTWGGHSDVVQPTLERGESRWFVFTCRESRPQDPPRVVLFDDRGRKVWEAVDAGHMDMGWTAHVGPDGAPLAMAVRISAKSAGPGGFERAGTETFVWDALAGTPAALPFDPYQTLPVDLDGDGIHEFVYAAEGGSEAPGVVVDRAGRRLGDVGGAVAHASRFTRRPGEQILSFTADGTVTAWADRHAQQSEAAAARYAHPYYEKAQRLSAVGYNRANLGGL